MKKYKTLKDHVYDYITEQVTEGTLLPGHRINETALSQELSVSRTPVREALIQLSCEGILDNVPRKGFVLKEVTEREAKELYTVIGTLDGLAARTACDALTQKDLMRMDFYIKSMDLAINTGSYLMYLEQQDAFHQVYMDKCDNEVLADTISRLKSKFFTRGYSEGQEDQNKKLLSEINEEHREILKLFQEKKKDELSRYLAEVHWCPTHAHNELMQGSE